jgi:hypothetical protein
MQIFGEGPVGCFLAFNITTQKSKGVILTLPGVAGGGNQDGGGPVEMPVPNAASGIIVTSVSLNQNEAVSYLKCFNNAIYTYVFGTDVGDMGVDFLVFLEAGMITDLAGGGAAVATGARGMGATKTALQNYANSRISSSKKPATLSMGDSGAKVEAQVVGMSMSTSSVEHNIQAFRLVLKTVSIQGG